MDIGPTELILILVIVIVLFGVGRIGKLGKELGSGIRGFKEGLQSNDKDDSQIDKNATVQQSIIVNPDQPGTDTQVKEQTHEPRTN